MLLLLYGPTDLVTAEMSSAVSPNGASSPLLDLPAEIMLDVCDYLSLEDLMKASSAGGRLQSFIDKCEKLKPRMLIYKDMWNSSVALHHVFHAHKLFRAILPRIGEELPHFTKTYRPYYRMATDGSHLILVLRSGNTHRFDGQEILSYGSRSGVLLTKPTVPLVLVVNGIQERTMLANATIGDVMESLRVNENRP